MSLPTNRGQHLIGKEVGGCILEQLIGYGGSSVVFLGQPRDSQQKVAVKVFLPHSTMDAATQKSFYRRFLREAQAASELDHPSILSIYSYGELQGMPYIIMPYMPGGTLSEYVKKHGPLTLRDALSYFEQIADALDYAHKQGCVHCDVKPANILLEQDGHVLLSDFGIVRFMQGAVLNAQQSLKSTEILMGTPEYASPEQALGEPLDGRSDIYSLAVTLFFLLTGFPPFRASSPIKVLLMHVNDTPPKLSQARADVSPSIDSVIEKALSKYPIDRYQSAGEFSRELSAAVAQSRNIDRVELTSAAIRTLEADKKELDHSQQSIVVIKPLARQPFRISRTMAIALVLGIVLLGSVTVAVLFYTASGPRPTPTSTVTPTPTGQIDDLAGQEAGSWPSGDTQYSRFYFSNQKYYIMNKSELYTAIALFENHTYKDFSLTVTCSQISPSSDGFDNYGVVFRADAGQSHYYVFYISSSGDEQYSFYRFDQGNPLKLKSGQASSIRWKQGQDNSNTITVVARGNTFTFYVNKQKAGTVTDPSPTALTSGEVGLSVEDPGEEVACSGLYIS